MLYFDRISDRNVKVVSVIMTDKLGSLMLSKLQIPLPLSHIVPRAHLIARMNEGWKRKATFVTAPAGYGKTTLISDWVRKLDASVGWLSLDSKDNDINRFWQYVVKAFELAAGVVSDPIREATPTLTPGQYEPFLIVLLNELHGLSKRFVLVLDDWHLMVESNILASVAFFLEYLPPCVHVCFLSRSSAGFTKARWMTRDWVHELDTEQLRFDFGETADFFNLVLDKEMRREHIEQYLHHTEGWITGLKLVALSMRYGEREPGFVRGQAGAIERVGQFLLEEVFESLEPSMRQFLMDVSILHRMNGAICEAVVGVGGAAKLAELVGLNLFLIPLDENKEWYRFHHLFGEFLKQQLNYPGRANELLKAAAVWSESQELLEEAVDYYLAGQYFDEAIHLLEQMKGNMIQREFSTLRGWLSSIPEPLLTQHVFLHFSYIFCLLWHKDLEQAEQHLLHAEQYYEDNADSWSVQERNRYLGYFYYVRNHKATYSEMDMASGLKYIQLSLQHSPQGIDLIFAPPPMPLSPSIRRSFKGKRGMHAPRGLADTFFLSMIEFMTGIGLQNGVTVCYGELLYERHELEQAEHYLKLGMQGNMVGLYQPEKVYVPACLFLSRISKSRRDDAQALRWLEVARRKVAEDDAKGALILIEAEMAALKLERGNPAAAVEWKNKYNVSADDPVSVVQLYIYTFLVRILMETGELDEACSLAEKLLHLAVKDHRPMDSLDIQVLQAMMLQLEDKQEQALLTLEEALAYAEPDDYVRVFVDKGRRVAELLMAYIQQRQKGYIRNKQLPSLSYVRRVLSCFDDRADITRTSITALGTLLTKREMAVFRCMEEGMDSVAIAESLGIGVGTLKTHINHIYGKLQVNSRLEAIKRGNELYG